MHSPAKKARSREIDSRRTDSRKIDSRRMDSRKIDSRRIGLSVLRTTICLALLGAVFSGAVLIAGCGGLRGTGLEGVFTGRAPLDEPTVAAGLKEALALGTQRAIETTSARDGFLDDPVIHIPLPQRLQTVANTLRSAGLDRQVEDLEIAMNRAAEEASGEAWSIFHRAVLSMSIEEAFSILRGPDDAATRYFRSRTENQLEERFTPIVTAKMREVGLYQAYTELQAYYESLPFISKPLINLEAYVTRKALDGLFITLASEEKKIRENPAARTSELLRRVFGSS